MLSFFNRFDEITKSSYIPINDDILRHKSDSTQNSEYEEEKFSTVINCGTHIQEFKILIMPIKTNTHTKWLQAFAGIEIVLFMMTCSDYDIFIQLNPLTSRLRESIRQFQQILDSKYLNTAGVIVFLNKQDILEEKIRHGIYLNAEDFYRYPHFALSKADDVTEEDDTIAYKDYIKARTFIKDEILVS